MFDVQNHLGGPEGPESEGKVGLLRSGIRHIYGRFRDSSDRLDPNFNGDLLALGGNADLGEFLAPGLADLGGVILLLDLLEGGSQGGLESFTSLGDLELDDLGTETRAAITRDHEDVGAAFASLGIGGDEVVAAQVDGDAKEEAVDELLLALIQVVVGAAGKKVVAEQPLQLVELVVAEQGEGHLILFQADFFEAPGDKAPEDLDHLDIGQFKAIVGPAHDGAPLAGFEVAGEDEERPDCGARRQVAEGGGFVDLDTNFFAGKNLLHRFLQMRARIF